MGLYDRDWYRDAIKEKNRQRQAEARKHDSWNELFEQSLKQHERKQRSNKAAGLIPIALAFVAVIWAWDKWAEMVHPKNPKTEVTYRSAPRGFQEHPPQVQRTPILSDRNATQPVPSENKPQVVIINPAAPTAAFDNAADNQRILSEAKEREIRCKWWKIHGLDYDLATVRENIKEFCR